MMLSKKILRLKKKIKNHYSDIVKIKYLIEENKKLNLEVKSLIIKSKEQEEKFLDLKERIDDLEKYKDICSNDIPIMASAITELYNILSVVITGKSIVNKSYEEEYFNNNHDDVTYSDLFDIESLENTDKKKKKVYH